MFSRCSVRERKVCVKLNCELSDILKIEPITEHKNN